MTKSVLPWYNHTGWLGVKHPTKLHLVVKPYATVLDQELPGRRNLAGH